MISANNFKRQWEDTRDDVLRAVEEVGSSGWYILGNEVAEFEQALARYWTLPFATGVASGLDALEIGLRAMGCGPGDRVLTSPISAFATTLAIVKLGAIPVYADSDPYGLIDLERCRRILERHPGIRFFVPVHLYGHALDMDLLASLAKEFDLRIVEDCAQSIGARHNGRPTGSCGEFAACSFYPTKNLGALGDAGALLCADPELAAKARALRDYGQTRRYRHEWIGYNSRLDEIHAAILRQAFLPRLACWIEARRKIAAHYCAHITNPNIRVPGFPNGSESSCHLFPVLVAPEKKTSFMGHLADSGIEAGEHYPLALLDQPAMASIPFESDDGCPEARRFCASEVSLPIHPYLTADEISSVTSACNRWV